MKITFVCDVLGKPNNGTTLAAYNLIGYLKQAGHDVTVVCADPDKKGEEGFVVVPVKNFGPLNLILKANNVTLAKGDRKVLRRVMEGSDVVHILIPFWLGSAAVKVAKELNIPITASFHAQAENFSAHIGCMNSKLVNHIIYSCYFRHVYRYVDCVHYPTAFIRDLFEGEMKCKLTSRVISNGVNDTFFLPREKQRLSEKFTILCLGRFSREKEQEVLIKAVGNSPLRDDIKIYFAGSGPREKKLKKLARRKKVDADFRFYARDELLGLMHGADLYVHTAIVEIEAIACLEAIVSGLVPIICNSPRSATKGFAVDEHCLFRMGDSRDLAEKIAYFYRRDDRIEEYRKRYEAAREQYRQGDCMREMERMLEDVAHAKKQHE